MKKSALALSLAIATLAAPIMAEEVAPVNLNDAQQVFAVADSNGLQLASLSQTEMKETQGALAPWIIGGGVGGAIGGGGYVVGWARGNYAWSTTRFVGNTATGALIGGSFGALGAAAGGGMSVGANIWRVNSFSLNYGVNSGWRR